MGMFLGRGAAADRWKQGRHTSQAQRAGGAPAVMMAVPESLLAAACRCVVLPPLAARTRSAPDWKHKALVVFAIGREAAARSLSSPRVEIPRNKASALRGDLIKL